MRGDLVLANPPHPEDDETYNLLRGLRYSTTDYSQHHPEGISRFHWWTIRDSNPAEILRAKEATTPSSPIAQITYSIIRSISYLSVCRKRRVQAASMFSGVGHRALIKITQLFPPHSRAKASFPDSFVPMVLGTCWRLVGVSIPLLLLDRQS